MLEIKSFIFGPFQTNTYVVNDGQQVWLIDPACSNEYERQVLYKYIEDWRLKIGDWRFQIIATHGHLDHLWGAKWATETWRTPVLMHEADIPMAKAMQQQYNMFGVRATAEEFAIEGISNFLSHKGNDYFKFLILSERLFQISNMSILSTPGHTPGSVCLYWPEEKALLSGDTLFCMGYGRTDLPGGNMGQLIDSLERLFALPADVRVYPGHGEDTTIGAERR